MTVEVLGPLVSDFGDLSKQLGFGSLGDLDFSSEELDQMATDFLAPAVTVPELDPAFGFSLPPPQQHPTGSADGGSSATVDGFVPLQALQTSSPFSVQPHQPALTSADSQQNSAATSNWTPSTGGEASSDEYTPDSAETQALQKKDPRIGRRKPEVDLTTITDLAERRKQRRLAKNRATAATSRERKRRQLSELQTVVTKLEKDKALLAQLLSQRDSEIAALKSALNASKNGSTPQTFGPALH